MADVTEINPATTEDLNDSPGQSTRKSTNSARKNKGGRPTKDKQRPPDVRQPQFFDRVASVPREDWGNRAFMYVYADEPVCKAKTFGTTRYLLKSSVPILDLEHLKEDYGSFKGWMSLNLRKTGKDATDEVDRLDFEIYDPKHPPKIPRAAWANDDRNARWIALLPPEPPAPNAAATSLMDSIKVYKEIRDEVRDEQDTDIPAMDQTRSTLETMKLAKELFAPPTTAPAVTADSTDPWSAAEKILNMRSENPMVAILQEQMKAAATAAENERDRAFKAAESAREREFKLQEKLLEARTTNPATAEKPKTLMEQLTDFKALKELFNGSSGNGESVRVGRTTGLDVVKEVTTKFFESDLANGVGQWLGSLANKNANGNGVPIMANPPTNGVQHQQPAVENIQNFIRDVLNPALLSHYIRGLSGSDFAGWLADGYPAKVAELQNFTHPMIPGKRGADAIIAAYKNTPSMWPALSSQGEERFTQFVHEFCAWKPEAEEDVIEVEGRTVESEMEEEGPERI